MLFLEIIKKILYSFEANSPNLRTHTRKASSTSCVFSLTLLSSWDQQL